MTRIIYSWNDTAAFRHYFHFYAFIEESARLTRPELVELTPYHYEAELLAFDYKEYRNGLRDMAGNNFKGLPSGA